MPIFSALEYFYTGPDQGYLENVSYSFTDEWLTSQQMWEEFVRTAQTAGSAQGGERLQIFPLSSQLDEGQRTLLGYVGVGYNEAGFAVSLAGDAESGSDYTISGIDSFGEYWPAEGLNAGLGTFGVPRQVVESEGGSFASIAAAASERYLIPIEVFEDGITESEEVIEIQIRKPTWEVDTLAVFSVWDPETNLYQFRADPVIRVTIPTQEAEEIFRFTNSSDNVDLNALADSGAVTQAAPWQALDGNDVVTLPSESSAATLLDQNGSLAFPYGTDFTFDAGEGHDSIDASALTSQAVTIQGGNGLDTLIGGRGNDSLQGDSGDDFFRPGGGSDFIDGGENPEDGNPADRDVVQLPGQRQDYLVSDENGEAVYLHLPTGDEIRMIDIEEVEFERPYTSFAPSTIDNVYLELIAAADAAYELPTGIPEAPFAGEYSSLSVPWQIVHAHEVGLPTASDDETGPGAWTFENGYFEATPMGSAPGVAPGEVRALIGQADLTSGRTLLIAFEGTDSGADWQTDIEDIIVPQIELSYYAALGPMVTAVKSFVIDSDVAQVFVTGHSLGGMLAQMFMQDTLNDQEAGLYSAVTFASPGISEAGTPDDRILHVEHTTDPIALAGGLGSDFGLRHWDGERVYLNADASWGHGLTDYVESASLLGEIAGEQDAPEFLTTGFFRAGLENSVYIGTDEGELASDAVAVLIPGLPSPFAPSYDTVLFGRGGDDTLFGAEGNDTLIGGAGGDQLDGGPGKDVLVGGDGADTFTVSAASESAPSVSFRDIVRDFVSGEDRIDLSALGDGTPTGLSFIGTDSFTGAGAELRLDNAAGNILQADLDGDRLADMELVVQGGVPTGPSDFIGVAVVAPGTNTFEAGPGADAIALEDNAETDVVTGTPQELDGDTIANFRPGDQLVLEGSSFGVQGFSAQLGSAILRFDTDLDGSIDSTVTLLGDFEGAVFDVAPGQDETVITYALPTDVAPGIVARDDQYEVAADGTLILTDLLANDTATPLAPISITALDTTSLQGTASLGVDGRVTYDPAGAFDDLAFDARATDSFVYTVSGGGISETAAVTINLRGAGTEPDPDPAGAFTVSEARVVEGDSGITLMRFTVTLTRAGAGERSVDFTVTGQSADPGVDFTAATGTLEFGQGQTQAFVEIEILGDVAPETDETLTLTLSNPGEATITVASATGIILDDDMAEPGLISGTEAEDSLYGGIGDDIIDGAAGDDYVTGEAGSDVLRGGRGDDGLFGRSGDDSLLGGAGDDWLLGGEGHDTLIGGAGSDRLEGGGGADWFITGRGADTIADFDPAEDCLVIEIPPGDVVNGVEYLSTNSQTEGEDLLIDLAGGATLRLTGAICGDPETALSEIAECLMFVETDGTGSLGLMLNGTPEEDSLLGVETNDQLAGAEGDDFLHGGGGHDEISGGTGDDGLFGGDGDDQIEGGEGKDLLIGGAGNDTLTGGSGADVFVVDTEPGHDIITDFVLGEDSLSLPTESGETNHTVRDMLANIATIEDNDLVLALDEERSIRLVDVVDPAETGEVVEDYEELLVL